MEKFLKGKRILVIAQFFYDYHIKIVAEIEKAGGTVDLYENKLFPEDAAISAQNLATSLRRWFLPDRKKAYNTGILAETKDKHYDFLFCIGGFSITLDFLEVLKNRNPGINTIIYFWDSFSVWNYAHLAKEFGQAFSFDPDDCKKYPSLQYLPLFYTEEFENNAPAAGERIDLLYIGSMGIMTTDRGGILEKISRFCKTNNYSRFIWLYYNPNNKTALQRMVNRLKYWFYPPYRKYIKTVNSIRATNDFIKENVLSRSETAALMSRAACIVDIPVKGQTGLTIRTMEALAQHKKVITSNRQILNEKVFDPAYVHILSENFTDIDKAFIDRVPSKAPSIEEYRLSNWLRHCFQKSVL